MPNLPVTREYGLFEFFLSKQRAKMADKLIPQRYRKGRILDIGCGLYPFFLINTNMSEKYGLDKVSKGIDEEVLEENKISLINFDIEKEDTLPFEDNYFDIITMLAVFEHIEPKRLVEVLNEIYRILKPSGKYIMTTPASWTDLLLKFMAKLRLVSPTEIREHKDSYSHFKICSIFWQTYFGKEKKISLGYFEVFMNIWAVATK